MCNIHSQFSRLTIDRTINLELLGLTRSIFFSQHPVIPSGKIKECLYGELHDLSN